MEISSNGVELIESEEGFRSSRYPDAIGVPTIGFGTTAAVIGTVPASCTLAQATDWLKLDVDRSIIPAIEATGCPLNQNQIDALCDFAYNLGAGYFEASHSMGAALHAHDYAAVANAFMLYDEAGGHVLSDLEGRRERERALFETPVKASTPSDPYHYAWFDPTTRQVSPDSEHPARHANERGTVREYDAKRQHPHIYPHRLNRLRANLAVFAERLDEVMREDPKHNEALRREWRRGQLMERAAGKEIAH